jgi:hypothetical protein
MTPGGAADASPPRHHRPRPLIPEAPPPPNKPAAPVQYGPRAAAVGGFYAPLMLIGAGDSTRSGPPVHRAGGHLRYIPGAGGDRLL